MKNILIKLVAMVLVMSFLGVPTSFASEEISVKINGETLIFDVPPQIVDGRTMVPMRTIFEALGTSIEWDGETKTITAKKAEKTIKATIGKKEISINEKITEIDVAPVIIDSRTLVPARFVAEALGAEVAWDGDTKSVLITYKTEKPDFSEISGQEPIEFLYLREDASLDYMFENVDIEDVNSYMAQLENAGYQKTEPEDKWVYKSYFYINAETENGISIDVYTDGRLKIFEHKADIDKTFEKYPIDGGKYSNEATAFGAFASLETEQYLKIEDGELYSYSCSDSGKIEEYVNILISEGWNLIGERKKLSGKSIYFTNGERGIVVAYQANENNVKVMLYNDGEEVENKGLLLKQNVKSDYYIPNNWNIVAIGGNSGEANPAFDGDIATYTKQKCDEIKVFFPEKLIVAGIRIYGIKGSSDITVKIGEKQHGKLVYSGNISIYDADIEYIDIIIKNAEAKWLSIKGIESTFSEIQILKSIAYGKNDYYSNSKLPRFKGSIVAYNEDAGYYCYTKATDKQLDNYMEKVLISGFEVKNTYKENSADVIEVESGDNEKCIIKYGETLEIYASASMSEDAEEWNYSTNYIRMIGSVPTINSVLYKACSASVGDENENTSLYENVDKEGYDEYLEALSKYGYYKLFTHETSKQEDVFISFDKNEHYQTVQCAYDSEGEYAVVKFTTDVFDIDLVMSEKEKESVVNALENSIEELKALKKKAEKAILEYEDAIEHIEDAIDDYEDKIDYYNDMIDDYEDAISDAQDDLKDIANERNVRMFIGGQWTWVADQSAMERVRDRISEYNDSIKEIKEVIDMYKEGISELKAKKKEYEEEIKSLKDIIDNIDDKIAEIENMIERFE